MKPLLLAGVWLGALASLASEQVWAQVTAGVVGVTLPVLLLRGRSGIFLGIAALGVIALAWMRWQSATAPPPSESIAWWADGDRHTIIGVVAGPPEPRGSTQRFTVRLRSIESAAGPVAASGSVQVRVAASRRVREGDVLRVSGALSPPPILDDFDYRAYLARRGVYGVMEFPALTRTGERRNAEIPRALSDARTWARTTLWEGMPATRAALAEGILIGRRAEIPRDVSEEFNRAGVSHLVAISGFNIALVGGVVLAAGAPFLGRRRAAWLALGGIAVYGVFVGMTPPVARAVVMGSVALVAVLCGRPHGAGSALVMAAAALTLHDPRILNDLSFQLSFAATAGLLVLAPWPSAWGRRLLAEPARAASPGWRSLALAAWDTLAVTLCATLATLPIILLGFGRLSVVTLLANLLLVPLFPAVLICGAAGLALAAVPWLSPAWTLAPLNSLLDLTLLVVRTCARFPGATVPIAGFTTLHATLAYTLLAIAAIGRLPGRRLRAPDWLHPPVPLGARPLPVLAFAPAALLVLSGSLSLGHRQSRSAWSSIEVMPIPGYASLVRLPNSGSVLVDAGLSPTGARFALDDALSGESRTLPVLILSTGRASSVGGVAELLRRYRVTLALAPPEAIDQGGSWLDALHEAGTRVEPLRDGLTIGGAEARIEVTPPRRADQPWSVRVRHGAQRLTVIGAGDQSGVRRADRTLSLVVTQPRGTLSATVPAGSRAALLTDGQRVRLQPPRGTNVTFTACASVCTTRQP